MERKLPSLATIAAAADPAPADRPSGTRRKLWDVPPRYMCSLVGTCLTVTEIRKLALRDGLCSPELGDYDLHGLIVGTCRHRSRTTRVLHKILERRYATAVRRFSQGRTPDELRELWAEGVDKGDVAGPLWALLTHPCSTFAVLELAFGDVHMLSHALGASRRIDQKDYEKLATALEKEQSRTAALRRVVKERDDALQSAEGRAAEQSATLVELRARSADERSRDQLCSEITSWCERATELRSRLEDECVRRESAERNARRLEAERQRAVDKLQEMERQRNAAEEEAEAAEAHLLGCLDAPDDSTLVGHDEMLRGLRVLYVGGRTSLVPHYRAVVERQGGSFVHHDGGLERSCTQLESLVSGCQLVVCPLDAISHSSWNRVKRACRHRTRSFLPVRTSSMASLVAAIRRGINQINDETDPSSVHTGSGIAP